MTWNKADLSVLLVQSTPNLSCSGPTLDISQQIQRHFLLPGILSLSRLSQKEKGWKKLPRKCVWERKKARFPTKFSSGSAFMKHSCPL